MMVHLLEPFKKKGSLNLKDDKEESPENLHLFTLEFLIIRIKHGHVRVRITAAKMRLNSFAFNLTRYIIILSI